MFGLIDVSYMTVCVQSIQDELEAFIGDYQRRNAAGADNHWIMKPVCVRAIAFTALLL